MDLGTLVAGLLGGIAIGILLVSLLERRSAGAQVTKRGTWREAPPIARSPVSASTETFAQWPWAVRFERWLNVDTFVIPIGLFVVTAIGYAIINRNRQAGLDYFVPLTDAFLHGHVGLATPGNAHFGFLNEILPGKDGRYYVAYPPTPAIVLMPAVAIFGIGFNQAWMTIFLGAINVALMSIAIRNIGVSRRVRVILSLVFGFGTIVWFSAQIGTAWHMSHVVAIFFMLLAIIACQRDRSLFLIGILFAGAITSRNAVVLAAPFFLAYLVDRVQRERTGDRTSFGSISGAPAVAHMSGLVAQVRELDFRRYAKLAVPLVAGLAIPALLVFAYNYNRFGSILETGYTRWDIWQTNPAYRFGLFSVHYFHKDFSALFLSRPAVIDHFPWFRPGVYGGPSILLTSPIFLWALKARRPDWFNVGAWISVVPILMTQLLYADTGGNQFGSETAQDVYPFLMLLTVRGLNGRISRLAWVAIAVGFIVNFWGIGYALTDWWDFGRGLG
jgi:hypothetical protein